MDLMADPLKVQELYVHKKRFMNLKFILMEDKLLWKAVHEMFINEKKFKNSS